MRRNSKRGAPVRGAALERERRGKGAWRETLVMPKGWPWGEGQILGRFDPMRFSRDYLGKSLEDW